MWNFIFIFSIAKSLYPHDWTTITPKQARLKFGEMPFWDYNETCVSDVKVKFSGKHVRFNEKEVRAWNTAILRALEDGLIPSFIGNEKC